jgi:CRISPR-associated protein Cas2
MADDAARVAELARKLAARFAAVDAEAPPPGAREPGHPTERGGGPPGAAERAGGPPGRSERRGGPLAAAEQVEPAQRNRRHWVVVSYDIPNDRRRTKVMKTLEGFGHRVQYSVFECELRPADLTKLKARLKGLIEPQEDDIRFYDLCETCQGKVTMLGRAKMFREKTSVVV